MSTWDNQKGLSEDETDEQLKAFYDQLNHIAPNLGIKRRFPPSIKYKYPPADKFIVTNIARALLHNPKFYYQVLHLMNKMNLMPPFIHISPDLHNDDLDDISISSESEESEIEGENINITNETFQGNVFHRQRKVLKTGIIGEKKLKAKTSNYKPRTNNQSTEPSSIFEPRALAQATIKIHITSDPEKIASQNNYESIEEETVRGFGVIPTANQNKLDSKDDQQDDWFNNLFSNKELHDRRLRTDEWEKYSVLKNYSKGSPSCRLYIKNLPKTVTEKDLNRIFGRYVDWNNEVERNMYHLQLFKSGRLRGQAFVSLPSEKVASRAIDETNTFLFEDKPMVVLFARSSKPQSDEKSEEKTTKTD